MFFNKIIVTRMERIIFLFFISSMLGLSQLYAYGERIGLPEGSVVTADFIDSDGDRVDDRYQPAPGKPAVEGPDLGLPFIEYLGSYIPKGVPDLRLGAMLYEHWWNFTRNLKSNLSPARHRVFAGHPQVDKFLSGRVDAIKFSFPNGTVIYYSGGDREVLVYSHGNYQAFVWIGEK